jgi:hypothetical protein
VLLAAGEGPAAAGPAAAAVAAVYFTLALCLLARLPYQDALRSLAGDGAAGLDVPASTALTAARRRLEERPLELLFQRVAGVRLPSRDPWAAVRGRTLRCVPRAPAVTEHCNWRSEHAGWPARYLVPHQATFARSTMRRSRSS